MYRLLIADDEALEREGLELTVERAMPGIFRFIHAGNGRMAIECAEEHRPHIAIL
ncbi:DNA-binding response regulator, partial [Paenibacillus sp. EKM208P]